MSHQDGCEHTFEVAELTALAHGRAVVFASGASAVKTVSDAYDGLDDDREHSEPAATASMPQPTLVFGSVDEFVRVKLLPGYTRPVGPSNRQQRRWSAEWWKNAEAVSRLEALWRSWEHLRLDGATGSSSWWREHLDYHMAILMAADGPFADSEDQNQVSGELPYSPPPEGMFPDTRGIS